MFIHQKHSWNTGYSNKSMCYQLLFALFFNIIFVHVMHANKEFQRTVSLRNLPKVGLCTNICLAYLEKNQNPS
jgi:hypothetical protein